MKKIKLDLDALTLASFDTVPEASEGAVQGHFVPTNPWCAANTYKSYCPNSLCTCPPPID
ncbi:MAG TPA: hypothetical protein VFJ16_14280 [Longimicrobium sp.]|nr:hypothetical protein [Longimicrobium sp.]